MPNNRRVRPVSSPLDRVEAQDPGDGPRRSLARGSHVARQVSDGSVAPVEPSRQPFTG